MKRPLVALLVLVLLALEFMPAVAQEAAPDSESLLAGFGYPELVVTTDGTDFTVPAALDAGRYHLVLENTGALSSELLITRVPDGMTADEVEAALAEADESDVPPPIVYELVIAGGASAEPGDTGHVVLDLAAGDWVFNLLGTSEETDEGIDLNKIVTVTGELPAVEDPAGAIQVGLTEFDFELADTVPAGPQIWQVTGAGEQPHHLVIAAVPDGTVEQQVIDLVNAFFGMPATPEAGAPPPLSFEDFNEVAFTGILSDGQTNWLEFDLAPGTYAAICFLPDQESGMPHVMLGMVEIFTVA
jgi:hypothetical protein